MRCDPSWNVFFVVVFVKVTQDTSSVKLNCLQLKSVHRGLFAKTEVHWSLLRAQKILWEAVDVLLNHAGHLDFADSLRFRRHCPTGFVAREVDACDFLNSISKQAIVSTWLTIEVSVQIRSSIQRLEIRLEEIHDPSVKIFVTQLNVTGRRLHFEEAILDHQQSHIEGVATKS